MAREFIAVKSVKAKGKRLTSFTLAEVTETDPRPDAEGEIEPAGSDTPDTDPQPDTAEPEMSDEEVRDAIIGQERLF